MERAVKEATVAELAESWEGIRHAFLIDFRGMKVPEVTELRDKIRETGSKYRVVKNTLAKRAVQGTPLESLGEEFVGPTALAWHDTDPVSLAKVLVEVAKGNKNLEFKAAVVDGQPLEKTGVAAVAALPSRDELIAKLMFLLESPLRRLAFVLQAPQRNLVGVLSQVAEGKEQG